MKLLALSVVVAVCASSWGEPMKRAMAPLQLEKITLRGEIGNKMDKLFERRATSEKARGKIFEETVNTFRTKWDDTNYGFGAGWQGEYWGKTMLGHVAAARYYDSATEHEFVRSKSIELIREFQQGDGYLGTYSKKDFIGGVKPGMRWKEWTFNLWCRKYTIWGLFEAYRLTGDREILKGATRSMDQWIDMIHQFKITTHDTGSFTGLSSMSILKPLLLIYCETKNAKYLDYAKEIVGEWDLPGDFAEATMPNMIANAFTDKPIADWYPDSIKWAKAYEFMSSIEGLIEYARITGDKRVFDATKRLQEKLETWELNAMGSVGYFDRFANAAKQPVGMSEPCDVVHWMRVNKELYLMTGEGKYFDAMELCFYNAFLASVFRDGEWGVHMLRGEGRRHRACPPQTGMMLHQCCIDNAPRGFADFASMAVTEASDGAILVNTYQDLVAFAQGAAVSIFGNYPVSDEVYVSVNPTKPVKLRLRVPGWCKKMTVAGKEIDTSRGWYEISEITREKICAIKFEMPAKIVKRDIPDIVLPKFTGGNHNFEIPKWTINRNEWPMENPEMLGQTRGIACAGLRRGPLILAKSRLAGATLDQTLKNHTINREDGWACKLEPTLSVGRGTWGAWKATFTNGERSFSVNVSDYQSAADFDDASNWFSVNF